MKMPVGTRIKFSVFLTSEDAGNSCVVYTPTFKNVTSKETAAYLKGFANDWVELLNNEFGVTDFHLMSDEEAQNYILHRHKHLIGESHEDTGIRH